MNRNIRLRGWAACLWAGSIYAVLVYVIGFALGTVRVLVLVPRFGATLSVLLESPLILSASWLLSKATVKRFEVPEEIAARVLMGAVAFVVLMCGELAVFVLVFGRPLSVFVPEFATVPGAIGLAGQLAFAAFPLLQARRSNT